MDLELEKNGNVVLKASGEGSKPYQVFPNLSKVFSLGRVGGQLCNMGALQREQKIATQNMPSPVACAAGLMVGGKAGLCLLYCISLYSTAKGWESTAEKDSTYKLDIHVAFIACCAST